MAQCSIIFLCDWRSQKEETTNSRVLIQHVIDGSRSGLVRVLINYGLDETLDNLIVKRRPSCKQNLCLDKADDGPEIR
jgi:hypothetical protein